MKSDICLIHPPSLVGRKFESSQTIAPPLGLAYIAAVLENNGYKVSIIDACVEDWRNPKEFEMAGHKILYLGLSYEEIAKRVRKSGANFVGVSATSTQRIVSNKIISTIKNLDKDIITIIGGPHPTIRPVECLKDNHDVDFAVFGEGEYSFLELLQGLNNGKELKNVDGIIFRKYGQVIRTNMKPLIQNLDELPFPARHLLPMEKYYEVRPEVNRWTNMITSRGCPFNCVFCSINITMGRRWRPRSPENVVDEIEEIVNKHGINYVSFFDDNMTLNKDRTKKICELIKERSLDIGWETPNGIRADTLDESILKEMKSAGCKAISVAPESGNQEVVNKIIEKNLDLKTVERAVAMCSKLGIRIQIFFVIGMVGETLDNIKDTVEFARKLRKIGPCLSQFNIAQPYYGTRLYHQAREKGHLTKPDGEELEFGLLNNEPMIHTPEFSPEDILRIEKQATAEAIRDHYYGSIFNLSYLGLNLRRLRKVMSNPLSTIKRIREVNRRIK